MNGDTNLTGPPIYHNWQLALRGETSNFAFETPLFTDAHITSKQIVEKYGPYEFINTVPIRNRLHLLQPAIVLRVESYINYKQPKMDETKEDYYHGGSLVDEAAALVSLCLGIRIKAGDTSREFSKEGDPRGLPISSRFAETPNLPPVHHPPVLPRAIETHSLDKISTISKLHQLRAQDATALLRAARLFQDGIWISETDPLLSWIMLVSAVEATAGDYWKSYDTRAKKRGATRRFVDFVLRFLPIPPSNRPEKWACLDWQSISMQENLTKIYSYRSRALHEGIPFPAPMGSPPLYQSFETKAWEEVPSGLASSVEEHVWLKKDLPMNLHIFEYIVRNCILKWWQDTANNIAA